MISEAQYEIWLRDPAAQRVVLAELHHADGVEYVATRPFISKPTDSLPNCPFDDVLTAAVDIAMRIDAQVEAGDLELTDDGKLTHWREYHWAGWPVILKLGDVRWSYDDFRVLARQINGGVSSARRGSFALGIYDSTALLDKPIETEQINGHSVPLVFGRVFCGAAIRVSTSELRYRASWLPVTSLVVRDGSGPVIGHTPDYVNGGFVADAYSPRALMCEINEPHNTPELIINWVADYYGLTVDPNLSVPNVTLGMRYEADINGRLILDDVCGAIGGFWQVDLQGRLTVQLLTEPLAPDLVIDADDIEYGQIALVGTEQPWKKLTVNYNQNRTPITDVAGSIETANPELAEKLRKDWQSIVKTQHLPNNPLAGDEVKDTVLALQAEAEAECTRLLALRGVRRERWELSILLQPQADLVGKALTVNHPRLAGRVGRIIASRLAPTTERNQLEVWY